MKTRALLFSLFSITLVAIGITVTLLFNWAPANARIITALFTTIFVSLAGLLFFGLLIINYIRYRATPAWQSTMNNGRWAILIAGFLTLALLLRSFQLWNIATGLALMAVLVVLDLLWRRHGQINIGPNPGK